jgi:hypothetical protein
MTNRRFPPPWTVHPIPGDASWQSLAYVYSRDSETDARTANVLTPDEAGRIAINVAKLPELLSASER